MPPSLVIHEITTLPSFIFDDHMYIHGSEYSPEKRVFACWSREDSHGQVWDAQIGQRVFKFQTFSVAEIPLALIEDTQTFIQDVDVLFLPLWLENTGYSRSHR